MDLYGILSVPATATVDEIKKAYSKLALKYHPDRNPDKVEWAKAKFIEINEAYTILTDPDKRIRYDKFGHNGLQQQQQHQQQQQQQKKGPTITFNLNVSLKDMYNGATKRIKVNRNVLCNNCCGYGRKTQVEYNGPMDCANCQGKGIIQQRVNMGFLQLHQTIECPVCKGCGIPEPAKCNTCKGTSIIKGEIILELQIAKGSKPNHTIVFEQKGDEYAPNKNIIPGDIVVTVREQDPALSFERHPQNPDHLIYKKTISLCDALTGYSFIIEHLDGRKLHIGGNDIINPNITKQVKGEGMNSNGDLFIILTIEFPSDLSQQQKNSIRDTLTQKKMI